MLSRGIPLNITGLTCIFSHRRVVEYYHESALYKSMFHVHLLVAFFLQCLERKQNGVRLHELK